MNNLNRILKYASQGNYTKFKEAMNHELARRISIRLDANRENIARNLFKEEKKNLNEEDVLDFQQGFIVGEKSGLGIVFKKVFGPVQDAHDCVSYILDNGNDHSTYVIQIMGGKSDGKKWGKPAKRDEWARKFPQLDD